MKRTVLQLVTVSVVLFSFAAFPAASEGQSRRDRQRAEQLVIEGDRFYQQRNYDNAILSYARALAIVPQYPLAHYNKGRAHFNLQQYSESVREFSIALDQGYDSESIYSIRWRAHFAMKQFDEAMSDVRAALGKFPNNDYFYIAEGQILHERREFQNALNSYQRAVDLGTKNTNISYLMALSHNGLGNWQKQEELADKALKSATSMPDMAWFLLGDAQQRLRKYEDAIRSYENAKSVNPDLYGIYINLAETHRVQNRLREAIAVAQEGLQKFENDATLHINISWYYSLSDRHPLAILHAKKATEIAPDQYLGYTNLCRAYNDTGKLDLAMQNCESALRLRPGDGETNFYLGRTYQLKGDTDKAFDYYNKAVTGLEEFAVANPNYADAYYLLGNAYSVTEQNEKAIGAYLASLEIAPLFARSRFNLGVIYLREGERAKASEQATALQGIDAQLAKRLQEVIDQ
ncbi:MAG: tetratricopeptide repeat protein [Aridibacter famidurans]|nr:tetratricopeptide repeat protein [Aridibacter famidurans]